MPAVLVHGVPETPVVWEPLQSALARTDVVTPQAPGFGCARPEGFAATKEDYVEWLIGELEALQSQGPIDLVGHDWGGGWTVRVVSLRPDLVRSWVSDAAGIADISFEWHDVAKIWQTPDVGEQFFEQQRATDAADRGAVFEAFGVPKDETFRIANTDDTMARCILDLYRSATSVGKEWAPDFHAIPKPGMVLVPSDDPFLNGDTARAAARNAGAGVAELDGIGHWWMLQDPARAAQVLADFWSSL